MPDYDAIRAKQEAILVTTRGSNAVVVHGSTTVEGWPSTMSERLVVAMMGAGVEYSFSVTLPVAQLVLKGWTPAKDDVVTVTLTGSQQPAAKCQILGMSSSSTQCIIHLSKALDRYEAPTP